MLTKSFAVIGHPSKHDGAILRKVCILNYFNSKFKIIEKRTVELDINSNKSKSNNRAVLTMIISSQFLYGPELFIS